MITVRRHRHRGRGGAILLEAMVALAILGIAATSILALAIDASRATERARAREAEMRRANQLFEYVALWPIADLDRHLGERREGDWVLRITRSAETVYAAALLDSTQTHILLETSIYRPMPTEGRRAP